MAEQDIPTGQLDSFTDIAMSALVEKIFDPAKLDRVQKVIENGVAKGQAVAGGAAVDAVFGTVEAAAAAFEYFDKVIQALLAPVVVAIASHLLGVELSKSDLKNAVSGGTGGAVAHAVIGKVFETLRGPDGELVPSDDGAQRFMGMLGSLTFQSWFEGVLLEHVVSAFPGVEPVEETSKLAQNLISSLGLSRLARTALRPLVAATIRTPLEWKTNKTYRPQLLGVGDSVRQFLRGRWPEAKMREELARQGWSEERIDAFVNAQRKFFGVADVRTFVDRDHWSNDQGLQHLRDQGYDEAAAADALRLEGLRRIDQLENAEATALIGAYVDRRISRSEFRTLLNEAVRVPSERALHEELADVRLSINRKSLSPAEARACVKAKILSVVDYRHALEREGYEPDAVTALELLLRQELDDQKSIEDHRRQLEAERAAEKLAKAAAAATRKAEIDADRALARRGDESDLERAAIRGLIPFSRVEEIYRARYDADTVDVLLNVLETNRTDYLEQQQRAEDARLRGQRRAIDVGSLERAYLDGVLSRDRLLAHPEFQKFDPADRAILLADFDARKADRDAALKLKDDAAAAAKNKGIDLGRAERLVRRGIRPIVYFDQVLQALGFNAAARADMAALLQDDIDQDAAARQARADAEAALRARGLSLEEFRRAVLLGLKARGDYEQFLIAQGISADRQQLLLRELDDALAEAAAARQRRLEAARATDARTPPTSTLARAARLGVISLDTYEQRLVADGYNADDVAIERELLLLEIADVQAVRQARARTQDPAGGEGLSLADLARAVKRGLTSIDAYRARAVQLGLSADAVETQVRVLADELADAAAARARREQIDAELKSRDLSVSQLEEAVTKGLKTLDQFLVDVQTLGYSAADAELLAAELVLDLEAKGGPA